MLYISYLVPGDQDESVHILSLLASFSKDLKVEPCIFMSLQNSYFLFFVFVLTSIVLRAWILTRVSKQHTRPRTWITRTGTSGNLSSAHIRLYIYEFAHEMREDLDNIITAFKFFNKYGRLRAHL